MVSGTVRAVVVVAGACSVTGLTAVFVGRVVLRTPPAGPGLFTAPGVVAEALAPKALCLRCVRLKAYNPTGFPRNSEAVFQGEFRFLFAGYRKGHRDVLFSLGF